MICASPDGENSFCARCWHLKSVIDLLTIAAGTVMIECWVHLDKSIDGIPPPPGVVWDATGDNSTKLADEAAAQEAAAAENRRFLPSFILKVSFNKRAQLFRNLLLDIARVLNPIFILKAS